MSNDLAFKKENELALEQEGLKQFVTMRVNKQLFGIPVLMVQDVLRPQKITNIPLAKPEIMGAINLRGKIVTVIDMRKRLSLPEREEGAPSMQIVTDHGDEQYSLVVDGVGEVLNLPISDFEHNPANLSENWKKVSLGVYRLEGDIMVVLDIDSLVNF